MSNFEKEQLLRSKYNDKVWNIRQLYIRATDTHQSEMESIRREYGRTHLDIAVKADDTLTVAVNAIIAINQLMIEADDLVEDEIYKILKTFTEEEISWLISNVYPYSFMRFTNAMNLRNALNFLLEK